VVAAEDVQEAHLMTVGDAHTQGVDQDLEVAVQDMVGVHEIARNMGLVLNLGLIPQIELMEMAVQHHDLDPGQEGVQGQGLGPRIQMRILMKKMKTQDSLLWKKILLKDLIYSESRYLISFILIFPSVIHYVVYLKLIFTLV